MRERDTEAEVSKALEGVGEKHIEGLLYIDYVFFITAYLNKNNING